MNIEEQFESKNDNNELITQIKTLVDELNFTIESLEDANKGINENYLINDERIDNNEIFTLKQKLIEEKKFLEEKILNINL